jgi:hypothetical protein
MFGSAHSAAWEQVNARLPSRSLRSLRRPCLPASPKPPQGTNRRSCSQFHCRVSHPKAAGGREKLPSWQCTSWRQVVAWRPSLHPSLNSTQTSTSSPTLGHQLNSIEWPLETLGPLLGDWCPQRPPTPTPLTHPWAPAAAAAAPSARQPTRTAAPRACAPTAGAAPAAFGGPAAASGDQGDVAACASPGFHTAGGVVTGRSSCDPWGSCD